MKNLKKYLIFNMQYKEPPFLSDYFIKVLKAHNKKL